MRILGLAILAVVLSSCSLGYPSGTWRYRMTVEVETPEGLKTGSAVRQVHVQREYVPLLEIHGVDVSVKGEAVVVDLGERGVLFALLDGEDAYRVVYEAFPCKYDPVVMLKKVSNCHGNKNEPLKYYSQLKDIKTELAREAIPRMVTFKDRNDPKSVELVYAYQLNWQESKGSHKVYDETDNFEAMFGKGVKLKRVILEMTDDKVTKGVVRNFMPHWLSGHEFMEWYNSFPYGDWRREVAPNAFSQGFSYPAEWQLNQPAPAKHR